MKYAYVTVLSTNNYLPGVLAMFETLKKTKPKYNEFVVLVNEDITEENIQLLEDFGYKVIKIKKIDLSPYIHNSSENLKYWMNTFDKLYILELTQYDKIVYLDSDLQILKNLDELFELPHLSGATAGKEVHPDWDGVNSGLLVVVPEEGILDKILNVIKECHFDKNVGDQDIIYYYYNWPKLNRAISEKFNVFARYLDHYISECNYNMSDFYTIHYIGRKKPWMLTEEERQEKFEEHKSKNNQYILYYANEYLKLIDELNRSIDECRKERKL